MTDVKSALAYEFTAGSLKRTSRSWSDVLIREHGLCSKNSLNLKPSVLSRFSCQRSEFRHMYLPENKYTYQVASFSFHQTSLFHMTFSMILMQYFYQHIKLKFCSTGGVSLDTTVSWYQTFLCKRYLPISHFENLRRSLVSLL